jgi:hypothetical protein
MQIATPSAYFLYPIKWGNYPKIKRSYTTNILSGLVGNEQRSKLKNNMIRTLSFTVVTDGEVMTRDLKKRLRLFMPEIWGVAVPQYRMKITQPTLYGDTTVSVDSTIGCELNHFEGILIGRWNAFDYLNISTFTANNIITRDTLTNVWPVGTFAYPVMRGLLADVQEFSQPTPYHFNGEFTFVESYVWESD